MIKGKNIELIEGVTYQVPNPNHVCISTTGELVAAIGTFEGTNDVFVFRRDGQFVASAARQANKAKYDLYLTNGSFNNLVFWHDNEQVLFLGDISLLGGQLNLIRWHPFSSQFSFPLVNLIRNLDFDFTPYFSSSFSLSNGSKYLAMVKSSFTKLLVLNTVSGETKEFITPDRATFGLSYKFSDDARYIGVESGQGLSSYIIDTREVSVKKVKLCHFESFSPDGSTFAAIDASEFTISVWKTSTLEKLAVLRADPTVRASVSAATYTPDGKFLLTGYMDGSLYLWSTQDFTCLDKYIRLQSETNGIRSIVFSRKAKEMFLASCSFVKQWFINMG